MLGGEKMRKRVLVKMQFDGYIYGMLEKDFYFVFWWG